MTCTAERHGDVNAYRHYGCRCPEARAANAAKTARWRKRNYLEGPLWIDATGTRRRIQALRWMGWSVRDIAAAMGRSSHGGLDYILKGSRVHRDTASTVAAVYDQLSMRFPDRPDPRVRRYAEAQGWAPPLAWEDDEIDDPKARPRVTPRVQQYRWLDEIAVEEALAGRRVNLSHLERAEVVRRIRAAGGTHRDIAERLGISLYAADRLRSRVTARDAA